MDCVKNELLQYADAEKAKSLLKFFQAYPKGYGEGDRFIGVNVPQQRIVAKKYANTIMLDDIETLLRESVHEYRLTALFLLENKYIKATDEERKAIAELYLCNTDCVNNWDLVDSSAYKILGAYLFDKPRNVLYTLAKSENLWEQRIAIIATLFFIKQGEFEDTLQIAKILLGHKHDLIHKAVGWMLREIGNRYYEVAYQFLKANYRIMPRTMLRYAIEKFQPDVRLQFLKGQI